MAANIRLPIRLLSLNWGRFERAKEIQVQQSTSVACSILHVSSGAFRIIFCSSDRKSGPYQRILIALSCDHFHCLKETEITSLHLHNYANDMPR